MAKKKFYCLDMFPYPSGEGLHVGHVESYTATDIYSRYMKMKGYEVMHPQGWDAFGLPAENYAIKTGIHPAETTKKAVKKFREQMDSLGFEYDWDREINSSDPSYYKWTQWMFLKLYENGWAYKKEAAVNFCPSCKTVLANEQVIGGKCERCDSEVIQKSLSQWFFKITDFIEDQGKVKGLISGLDDIDWPESTKLSQRNWIGKSYGLDVDFKIEGSDKKITVFTTRADTIFGVTAVVLAPENPLIGELTKDDKKKEVDKYIEVAEKKSAFERENMEKVKTGVFTGSYCINPFNDEKVPVWIGDYVIASYGGGAVMVVPAHDYRDYEFARKFGLEIREVVSGGDISKDAFVDHGVLVNSGEFDGLNSEEAIKKIIKKAEKDKIGKGSVKYKLRDWLVSRQRYWGAPIPIIYCNKCGEVPVPEKDLPVKLPNIKDFKPTEDGKSPLAKSDEFVKVKCPKCGIDARREVDTMDTFVCSSWYFLRYADDKNEKKFASKKELNRWLPVDLYVGGAEHSVMHLLYARFFTKFLQKLGYVDFNEPFLKLRHQGIILGEDGNKMSKSKGNVVNPDDVVKEYGPDILRMYEMFMGPLEDMKPWNTQGMVGIKRFLEKVKKVSDKVGSGKNEEINKAIHKAIKRVTEDIEVFGFNTAISSLMILVNEMDKAESIDKDSYESLLMLLSPFAPFISEELWAKAGNKKSIFTETWPEYDKKLVKEDKVNLIVQINGKVRDKIEVDADISEDKAKEIAISSEKINNWVSGKKIKKVIFVKGKLINIVI